MLCFISYYSLQYKQHAEVDNRLCWGNHPSEMLCEYCCCPGKSAEYADIRGGGHVGQVIVRDTQIAHLLTLLTFANFESHWDILSEQLLLIYINSENHDMDDSFVLMN